MHNNGDYYSKLLKYSLSVPCPSAIQIDLDLKRTFPNDEKVMEEKFQKSLRNILLCYSTRNTSVGYCQGMNFIICRLLLIMDNEEQTFWLFVQIMEYFLSLFYYANLAGIIVETTLIETLLPIYLPDLHNFLEKNNFTTTTSNFIHKWMVCLFTQTLKFELAYTFMDFFFIDGRTALIKNSIFIFAYLQNEIMQQDSFEDIYMILTDVENKIVSPKDMIYFLYEKNFDLSIDDINALRNALQKPILNKLINGELLSTAKRTLEEMTELLHKKKIYCDPKYPFCLYDVEQNFPEYLVFKESKSALIIDDYYYIKCKNGYQDEKEDGIDEFIQQKSDNSSELLLERHRHVCDDQKLFESSQNFSDFQKIFSEEEIINNEKNKSQELKIYESLKKFKDVEKMIHQLQEIIDKKKKIIKPQEINSMIQRNKNIKYYPDNYSMFKPS